MRLITRDDISETYSKLYQKGLSFWLSRFNPDPLKRTTSTFNHSEDDGSYWWMIPAVRRRINEKITGRPDTVYETYFCEKYLGSQTGLKLLSPGCGTCTHEMRFARQQYFSEVRCMDIATGVLKDAEQESKKEGLRNMQFIAGNVNETELPAEYYDVVLFNASLHHFKNIDNLVGEKVYRTLKKGGLLVINEYVGADRLQYPQKQIAAMNKALKLIPAAYRTRYRSGIVKKHITGPGLLRMLITDPSECVDSESILPAVHKYFKVMEERATGGDLLMLLYKDIAHHFLKEDEVTSAILQQTFALEDEYLAHTPPDMLFGVYQK